MIKETGQQQIFYSSFSPKPNNITINGNLQNTINSKYNMNTPNSNITMIWNSKLKDCSYMFNECKQIVKINFSNFDSSEVTTMEKMFYNCRGLIKINFKNFNTSRVKNMNDMFAFCSSLTSLDLSSFDTSSVTEMMNMFSNCENLISLNLSNFDTSLVTDMSSMFELCKNLILLDVSNFNTSKVKYFIYMFEYCESLVSLNLYSFESISSSNTLSMFYGVNENLIYSINEGKAQKILDSIDQYVKTYNNNSNLCFKNSDIKVIKSKAKCIENCTEDDKSKFEHNNICYESCPEGTHNYYKNYYLCINDDLVESDIMSNELSDIEKGDSSEVDNTIVTRDTDLIKENISSVESNIENELTDFDETINKIESYLILNESNLKDEGNYNKSLNNNITNGYSIDCTSIRFFNNSCKMINNDFNIQNLITNIQNYIVNGSLDALISDTIEGKRNSSIKTDNVFYQITSTDKQKEINNDKASNILLLECENILKKNMK